MATKKTLVFVGPPDRAGRLAQLRRLLQGKPLAEDVDLEALATATQGFSGAEIAHLVNEAGLLAIKEAVAGDIPPAEVRMRREHFVMPVVGGIIMTESSSSHSSAEYSSAELDTILSGQP